MSTWHARVRAPRWRLSEGYDCAEHGAVADGLDCFARALDRISRGDHRLHIDHALLDQLHVTRDVSQHVQASLLAGVEGATSVGKACGVEAHVAAPGDAQHD